MLFCHLLCTQHDMMSLNSLPFRCMSMPMFACVRYSIACRGGYGLVLVPGVSLAAAPGPGARVATSYAIWNIYHPTRKHTGPRATRRGAAHEARMLRGAARRRQKRAFRMESERKARRTRGDRFVSSEESRKNVFGSKARGEVRLALLLAPFTPSLSPLSFHLSVTYTRPAP